jgi:hypothetical protein
MGTSQRAKSVKAEDEEEVEEVGSVENIFYKTLLVIAQKN